MNEKNLMWLYQWRYDARLHRKPKSKWRQLAAAEWIKNKMGTAQEFIYLWRNY